MLYTVLMALLFCVPRAVGAESSVAGRQESERGRPGAVSAGSEGEVPSAPEPVVETLFIHGGRIYLGNSDGGVVEALLIENGRVVAAGTEKRLRARLPDVGANLINLRGAVAVPGIQDAHIHVERIGESLGQLDLRGTSNYAEVVTRVAEVAANKARGEWILGAGWDQRLWQEDEFPTHEALSEAVPDHPVLLWRVDGFTALVNRNALELAELGDVLDPVPRLQGGRVLVDGESRATGVLVDRASQLVADLRPRPDLEQRTAFILRAQEELLARGITCVHDMSVPPSTLEIYERLRERGLLKIRVVAYVDGNEGLSAELLETLPRRPDDLDLLSVPGVMFHLDGDLGTRGAALLEDYSDASGERGHLWLTKERLTLLVHEAWQAGLQPVVQAVGDRANRIALDTFERMLQVDKNFARLRPRIEDARVISARDIPRFPELEVITAMLPSRALSSYALSESRLGGHRLRGTHAWRSLAPGLLQLAFGSDAPFGSAGPLQGIYAARMRGSHESLYSDDTLGSESLDGLGALAGYTRGPAHAVHQEDRRGQLMPGYWADLTIFDRDPVDGDPEKLLETKVLLTVINGRVVYKP